MRDEYHGRIQEFLKEVVYTLRERGQHDLASRGEQMIQELVSHDSIAEARWQQRREVFEILTEEVLHE